MRGWKHCLYQVRVYLFLSPFYLLCFSNLSETSDCLYVHEILVEILLGEDFSQSFEI